MTARPFAVTLKEGRVDRTNREEGGIPYNKPAEQTERFQSTLQPTFCFVPSYLFFFRAVMGRGPDRGPPSAPRLQ